MYNALANEINREEISAILYSAWRNFAYPRKLTLQSLKKLFKTRGTGADFRNISSFLKKNFIISHQSYTRVAPEVTSGWLLYVYVYVKFNTFIH